jgi:hypothetical protein
MMKVSVFSDLTPCSFGRACRLLLQGRKISQAGNQREAGRKQNLKRADFAGLGKDRGVAIRMW